MSQQNQRMAYRKVTAIVSGEKLVEIEQALQYLKVPGVSVSQVRGYGEYRNFYQSDLMGEHARIEIFCPANEAEGIANCIMDTAHTGLEGDGMIAVLPVEHLYCIRTKAKLSGREAC